jgi:hypothetical protein
MAHRLSGLRPQLHRHHRPAVEPSTCAPLQHLPGAWSRRPNVGEHMSRIPSSRPRIFRQWLLMLVMVVAIEAAIILSMNS